jgi:para-nitrobenzyl esterase
MLALLLVGCGGAPIVERGARDEPVVVTTARGPVRGERANGSLAFLGIPYARAPVGALRWRAPEPPARWTTPRPSRRPTRCIQDAFGVPMASREDCLFVNVHAPDPLPERAPVLVWIHGGAFVFGEGLQYDGGTAGDVLAAQHGLVVVSLNYRLGAFGFLSHPALDPPHGNYGLADQRAALAWVRENIAAFGGDPENVTIAGESAGGLSVCLHLIAPESAGLFHRAIVESGLCDSALPSREEAQQQGRAFAAALGCEEASDVGACLRATSVERIREADRSSRDLLDELAGARGFWPSVDGALLPGDFRTQVEAGAFARVPVLTGWTKDEGTLFVWLAERAGARIDEATFTRVSEALSARLGVSIERLRARYALDAYRDPGEALAAFFGHASLSCPSRRAARLVAAQGADVYVYRFDYPDARFATRSTRPLGAFHTAEIQYVFGHAAGRARFAQPADEVLHERIAGYWARFARTGDPNGEGAPPWPRYALDEDAHLVLDRVVRAERGADADACAIWEP